ncbi:uncharacterized protein [Elaeis guineensis]|uniref:uncharacterized protein n=1 Tax=Elaeis guineensis var. tenera TaxID=51953 RepID=UPI003C6D0DB1
MAKSLRSKKEKRLRTLRREIAEPFYNKKDAVKLAASKLPIRGLPAADEPSTAMDVEMTDGGTSQGYQSKSLLKPVGRISKNKLKKKLKLKKGKKHGKGRGKIRKRNI